MVFVPMAQAPPKAGAKEVLYSLNLIDEFTSLFSPKVIYAGLPRKAFPLKQAFVDIISVFLWLRKQRPRFAQGQPKGYFQMQELDRTWLDHWSYCPNEWSVEKAECQHAPICAITWPTWANIAVCQLCKERQPLWNSHDSWWPELNMFGSMPWCSCSQAQAFAGAKTIVVVQQSKFDRWVYILVFAEGDSMFAFPGSRPL